MKVPTEVTVGGPLLTTKALTSSAVAWSAEALTDKDSGYRYRGADRRGLSGLSSPSALREDLNGARRLARDAGCDAKIVAKVERGSRLQIRGCHG